ncbi:putative membrane protein [Halobacteriovorax marinus SJ]|uniref:Membrane protein n=1 Tax=Halobacteriovorax marinus (strain ATCC BAA-682 / DSM 15412 / SJ) TaxID=862908 RepID=E1WYN2_HALMS|nr:hypothetical protein [Halobacteriovorax marinus]CBW27672.1 putative membrane protein [Halobacteriovorax marinus SJ]
MNELFDKLILRIVFTLFLCGILFLYKYAHSFLYPSSRTQIFKRFFPSKNSADTIHLFSRLIGIGIILSEFYFTMSDKFYLVLIDFFVHATLVSFIYLISIYIIESIVLYNFEYHDEIIKRKNMSYALISFSNAIAVAYILKGVSSVSQSSIIILLFLWLLSMVLLGFSTKSYSLISKLSFNRLLVQKNLAVGISYLGFIWGWALVINASFDHELLNIKWYSIHVILKLILALLIIPIFRSGLIFIFKLQDDFNIANKSKTNTSDSSAEIGYGVYEGAIFFTSCFLTTVITGNINFGNFYPVF